MTPKEQNNLLKIWIPIEVLPNEGGLGVYPGSHLKKWDYDTVKRMVVSNLNSLFTKP